MLLSFSIEAIAIAPPPSGLKKAMGSIVAGQNLSEKVSAILQTVDEGKHRCCETVTPSLRRHYD